MSKTMVWATFPRGIFGSNNDLTITSTFNKLRNGGRIHRGIDISIPSGTTLKSPINGKAKISYDTSGYGRYIKIVSDDKSIAIIFAHLHSNVSKFNNWNKISINEIFGESGGDTSDDIRNRGNARGAHCHLEVHIYGKQVDPIPFLSRYTLNIKNGNSVKKIPSNLSKIVVPYDELTFAGKAPITSPVSDEETHTDVPTTTKKNNVSYNVTEQNAPGIWQIIKLLIDSSVKDKQVADSSISTQTGSLLNFFNKICQKPMVEFFGDTYGSQYYFFIRRPPFDRDGFLRMINNGIATITNDDIISLDLTWNNRDIYSWYQFIPYYNITENQIQTQNFPSIFFSEFAQIWGSKPLCVRSNYFSHLRKGYKWINGEICQSNEQETDNINRDIRDAISDFKFLIESNAYNAFTRRGSIVLKGNRQLKRGTAIYLEPTNEVFYIDSITQDFGLQGNNISRTTTLEVSRGMVYDYIGDYSLKTEVTHKEVKISYFNIIDFGDLDISKITGDNFQDFLSKWKVNIECFSYFMSKRQFINEKTYKKFEGEQKFPQNELGIPKSDYFL